MRLLGRPTSSGHLWWVVVLANLVASLTMASFVIYRFLIRELHDMPRTVSQG